MSRPKPLPRKCVLGLLKPIIIDWIGDFFGRAYRGTYEYG